MTDIENVCMYEYPKTQQIEFQVLEKTLMYVPHNTHERFLLKKYLQKKNNKKDRNVHYYK